MIASWAIYVRVLMRVRVLVPHIIFPYKCMW